MKVLFGADFRVSLTVHAPKGINDSTGKTSLYQYSVRANMTADSAVDSHYITNSVIESAVGLILVESGSRRNAMTVSCFSEAAHHPATLWVSVAKSTYTHGLILETGRFSLAILNRTQKEIALQCGTISGREYDKCASLDLYHNVDGFLMLHRSLASTACRIRQSFEIDDHTLFIADILNSDLDSSSAHLRHLLISDLKPEAATL